MAMAEVADGVHRFSDAFVNFYVVEGQDGPTLIDSGLPSMWLPLEQSLRALGHSLRDIRAVILTHARFDHLGLARRLQHCGLFLRERGILFSGDALVTMDPYTRRTGPRIVAGAATADSALNLA